MPSSLLWPPNQNGDGPPLPGVATPRVRIRTDDTDLLEYIRAMLFGLNIYSQCCSAEIYMGDAVLLEYIIMGNAVVLKYIRAMLGVAITNHQNSLYLKGLY